MSNVTVIGLGYVGLPLAVRAAEVGHDVIGVDADPGKVARIQQGRSYVQDVTDAQLAAVRRTGRLRCTPVHGDPVVPMGFDVAVIAVPTPLRSGVPDLSYVEAAARTVGRRLAPGGLVVLESTTYPGTTEGLVAESLEQSSGLRAGVDFHLGFSPERIDPGNREHTLVTTPKVVSGTTPEALERVDAFYRTLVDRTVRVSTTAVAEMTKIFENIFSHVNIALVNELAMISHELGVDVWEVIEAADTKPHGFLKHVPGPGVGGHCLPVDPTYLSWLVRSELGGRLRISDLAQEINDGMPDYVIERAAAMLPDGLAGASVLVLGVAYKPGSADLRETPAIPIVQGLQRRGAHVTVCDPLVEGWTLTSTIDLEDVASNARNFSLVIVVTDHDEFDYDKVAEGARLVLDCRRRLTPDKRVRSL